MKKFLNSLKSTASSVLSKDPYKKTDLDSLYFKKVVTKDLPLEKNTNTKTNFIIEDKINSLNRTILKGMLKKQVEARISQLVYNSRFEILNAETKELCEIIHYACVNNIPVRVIYIQKLLPNAEIDEKSILDEKQYEEWLKTKKEEDELPGNVFEIDDVYGVRNEKRGKQQHEQWKTNKKENSWRKL